VRGAATVYQPALALTRAKSSFSCVFGD
jgi:hypothetical protein